MEAEVRLTADKPVELAVMFNGFPVERIPVCHFCVANASLRAELSSQSDQLLRVITCARISETNRQLNKSLELNSFADDFNCCVSEGGFQLPDESFAHITMLVAADKKGVEAFRGCSPCCPRCSCSDTARLKLPWPVDSPPALWGGRLGAAELLEKVCRHPFPTIPVVYEAAHLPLPNEPLRRKCRFCKQLPYASKDEFQADVDEWDALRADLSKEGKRKFAERRSAHASSHMNQYKFEAPSLFVGMCLDRPIFTKSYCLACNPCALTPTLSRPPPLGMGS
eukprot:2116251-Pleurochrysis_carterae.AAC.1